MPFRLEDINWRGPSKAIEEWRGEAAQQEAAERRRLAELLTDAGDL